VWLGVVMAVALTWPVRLASQAVTVTTEGGSVQVQAPGFRFIAGETLTRLKDGLSVRVDLELGVLPRSGAAPAAARRQSFVLSYDLWEERFAVTVAGASARSISHVTSAAAEAWCVQQLALPVGMLGPLAHGQSFWVRLEYRVAEGGAAAPDQDGLTLWDLIDVLSRRRTAGQPAHAIEAGPFRVR
jgi:hypothetical protein